MTFGQLWEVLDTEHADIVDVVLSLTSGDVLSRVPAYVAAKKWLLVWMSCNMKHTCTVDVENVVPGGSRSSYLVSIYR